MDLIEEGAADEPRADDADAQRQRGEVEAAVHRAQRPNAVLLVYQHRYVVLAAPLRYRPARSMGYAHVSIKDHFKPCGPEHTLEWKDGCFSSNDIGASRQDDACRRLKDLRRQGMLLRKHGPVSGRVAR